MVCGRVLWHLGYTTKPVRQLSPVLWGVSTHCLQQELSYRVKGVLTDGFDSTTKSMRMLFLEYTYASDALDQVIILHERHLKPLLPAPLPLTIAGELTLARMDSPSPGPSSLPAWQGDRGIQVGGLHDHYEHIGVTTHALHALIRQSWGLSGTIGVARGK